RGCTEVIGGRGVHVGLTSGGVVVCGHALGAESRRVRGRLVNETGKEVAGRSARPTVQVVTTDVPDAPVRLGGGDLVAADPDTVDIERHPVGPLGADHVVPLAVVVGLPGADRLGVADVDTEVKSTVVVHVD